MFKSLSIGQLRELKSPSPLKRSLTDNAIQSLRDASIAKLKITLGEWIECDIAPTPPRVAELSERYRLSPNFVINEYGALRYAMGELG